VSLGHLNGFYCPLNPASGETAPSLPPHPLGNRSSARTDTTLPKFRWRLVDARAFLHTGAIRLVLVESISDFQVIAISYTWTAGIKRWRDHICKEEGRNYEERVLRGSRDLSTSTAPIGGSDDDAIAEAQLFFTIVAFFVLSRGGKFFWIDILCINQDEQKEKEFFVPRMGYLYCGAAETHAYPFGAKILSAVFSDKVYFPVWDTRAWTVQEQILSRNTLLCYAFQGDVQRELKEVNNSLVEASPQPTISVHTPVLNKLRHGRIHMLETTTSTVTCYMEKESWTGNFSTAAYMHREITVKGDWSQFDRSFARTSRYEALYAVEKSSEADIPEIARISMATVAERRATVEEDMIYCLLGTLDLDGFTVAYNIGFEEARLRVFEALEPKILAHVIGTDWASSSSTNNKDSALPRVVGSTPVTGILSSRSAILHCKYRREVGTEMTCRREKLRIWQAVDKEFRGSDAVLQATFGNNQLLVMQGASVFDTPEYASVRREAIPRDDTKVILVDMAALGVSSDDEASKIDKVVEFVEIGVCRTLAVLADLPPEFSRKTSLLALFCEEMPSGALLNKGAALILDASAFSTDYCDTVVE